MFVGFYGADNCTQLQGPSTERGNCPTNSPISWPRFSPWHFSKPRPKSTLTLFPQSGLPDAGLQKKKNTGLSYPLLAAYASGFWCKAEASLPCERSEMIHNALFCHLKAVCVRRWSKEGSGFSYIVFFLYIYISVSSSAVSSLRPRLTFDANCTDEVWAHSCNCIQYWRPEISLRQTHAKGL